MLYCMAIMRLVNCFVEPVHKKTGRSISELADAVGIPRMLVDIRHESSHRNLPSLRLVRTASMKALDWLKSNYWEPQRNAIPDVRKEVRSRLREMSFYLKTKHAQRSSSSQGKGKCCKRSGVLIRCNKLSSQIAGKLRASKFDVSGKRISKITNIMARLYSSYPSEVVAVLLEFFHLQSPYFSDDIDMESSDDSNVNDPGSHADAMCDLKTIITKLSNKKPGLILSILKTVLKMIEVTESTQSENDGRHLFSSKYRSVTADISRLCTLVHWLLMSLKSLKDSGRIGVIGESPEISADGKASPNVSLTKLLHKITSLSIIGDEHLPRSALILARMIGNTSLTSKLRKIPLLGTQDQDTGDESTLHNTESMLLQEEASIKLATEKLESLKSHLRSRSSRNDRTDATNKMWTVSKSWTPCPIGMLPCSFSSTAVLPVLDKVNDTLEIHKAETNTDCLNNGKREADGNVDENENASKRLRMATEEQEPDLTEVPSPLEGRLLIGGIWKKVSEEELLDIESNIKIFW